MSLRINENTVRTDSQDYGADEILYTTETVLFNKINKQMCKTAILFGVSPQLFPVIPAAWVVALLCLVIVALFWQGTL